MHKPDDHELDTAGCIVLMLIAIGAMVCACGWLGLAIRLVRWAGGF